MAELGEHYRPTDDARDADGERLVPGVYRVVGSGDDVALLRVADARGRRAHTGELRHVAPATLSEAFERAADPGEASPLAAVRNALSGLYWSVRQSF
ncbi:hypothetical protein [Halorussus caseinilyticus]|uniref:Uncharacterized protein n=1 Tax=Halorussus caseinilyticus TaxID=3034025 RepID=A0ABD5WMB1_9EURY|nr:hypothetical protein [Halorussus sp. DT72]